MAFPQDLQDKGSGQADDLARGIDDASLLQEIAARLRSIDVEHMVDMVNDVREAGPWRIESGRDGKTTIAGRAISVVTDREGPIAQYIVAAENDWPKLIDVLREIRHLLRLQ